MSYTYNDMQTCPACCGTGLDNYSLDHKCYTCYGTGYVDKIEKTIIKDEQEVSNDGV